VLTAVAERFPRLGPRAPVIGDFRALLQDLEGKILPDGSVADHASVALARLRRDIERQKKSIQESLERFLKAHREEGVLQEEFVTIRNERFVVPIIAGPAPQADGVIHGASSSGHTLFVEPLETIDLNNELVRLTEEEDARSPPHPARNDRTACAATAIPSARRSTMAELELIFAKAPLRHRIRLRHPASATACCCATRAIRCSKTCCAAASASPCPSAWSSTASAARCSSAAPTPAARRSPQDRRAAQPDGAIGPARARRRSRIPVFSQVLADIGDYQSIQENLSTFSAHVSHIREMALDVTPDSLVLLDELGAATDPEEGGALGVAIVEHFRAAGAFTLVSTHLMALKIYGASTEGVVNGSMGFDEETFEPTFHLQLGLPGKSAGLEIATRLGMPEDIMLRARRSMSDRERDVTRFLANCIARIEETRRWSRACASNSLRAERTKRNWRANGRSARPPS
jgi:DNA mismatch repair protein MutS2